MKQHLSSYLFITCLFQCVFAYSQNSRTQYPPFLKNAYFNFNLGYINFPFSSEQLEPGYEAGSIDNRHIGMRLIFFGYTFNKHLAAQVSYMKPVQYAVYNNINGNRSSNTVWMHAGTLSLKGIAPVSKKLSAYGEAGLAVLSRRGFQINNADVVKSLSYNTVLLGSGIHYIISSKWDLTANFNYVPGKSSARQPHAVFYSAGAKYNLAPLPEETVKQNEEAGYHFPKNVLQIGYATNALGYGTNNFLSKKFPIFWGGDIEINKGWTIHYQRNVFHTKKVFALELGTSAGYWESNEKKEKFYTLSVYPRLRFNVIRSSFADMYLFYSAAGPSYISKKIIDEKDSGRHFTFQDFMGMGSFFGKAKNLNAEVNINHYSNGNIFTANKGVKIPLTFTLGCAF